MSEYNMTIRGSTKMANIGVPDAEPAFEHTSIDALDRVIEDLARRGIKLAVNAGSSDSEKLYNKVGDLDKIKGLNITVAWVVIWCTDFQKMKIGRAKIPKYQHRP
jgi:hypothetical protein